MLSRYRSISRIAQHVTLHPRRAARVPTSHFRPQIIRCTASKAADDDDGNASPSAATATAAAAAAATAAPDDSPLGESVTGEHVSTITNLTHYPDPATPSPKLPRPLSTLLPSQPQHTSLPTYLAHARRLALSSTSTTYAGTVYEYIVLHALRRIGIATVRIGQTGDLGLDLVGYWYLPERIKRGEPPLRVVVQCKRLNRKVGPAVVRELEGAIVAGAPVGWRNVEEGVVGLVVGPMPASRGVVEGLKRSARATGWVCVEEVERQEEGRGGGGEDGEGEGEGEGERGEYKMKEGKIRQVLWNQKAKRVGLEGVDVVKRYDEQGEGDEVVLMWRGEKVKEVKDED